MSTTIQEAIGLIARAEPEADAHVLADKLLDTWTDPADFRDLLADAVSKVQRGLVQRQERTAFSGPRTFETVGGGVVARRSAAPARPTLSAFRSLAGKKFKLGNGEHVEWLKATTAEHSMRIVFLTKQRDGIDSTIGRHHAAIEAISEAGVECLADLLRP